MTSQDLRERMDNYRTLQFDSRTKYGDNQNFVISLLRNAKFLKHLEENVNEHELDPDNLFSSKEFAFSMSLVNTIFCKFKSTKKASIYGNVICIETGLTKDGMITFLSNHSEAFDYKLKLFNLPKYEQINFDRMWQMYWIARRNRILGEIYLDIPHNYVDKAYSHADLLAEIEENEEYQFSRDLLPKAVWNGVTMINTSPLQFSYDKF